MRMSVATVPTLPRASRTIGAILMDAGLLSAEDAEQILRLQRQNNLRFGEAAIRLGLLTEADIQYALARQFDYAYLRMSDRRAVSEEVVAAYQPFSAQTEQMRAIRGQLMLRWFDLSEQRQTLAVIGSQRGEGRSWLAANLAVVFAQLGERTLLIDANFRNPRQHELFSLKPEAGLADLLRGRDVYDEALTAVPSLEHLRVLCAGAVPANPQELLSRASFIYVLKTMADKYRSIVIDTPPALAFADAQIVSARAQGCLLVTKRHRTRLIDVDEVKARLEPTGAQLLGAVINE